METPVTQSGGQEEVWIRRYELGGIQERCQKKRQLLVCSVEA